MQHLTPAQQQLTIAWGRYGTLRRDGDTVGMKSTIEEIKALKLQINQEAQMADAQSITA